MLPNGSVAPDTNERMPDSDAPGYTQHRSRCRDLLPRPTLSEDDRSTSSLERQLFSLLRLLCRCSSSADSAGPEASSYIYLQKLRLPRY